MGIFKPGFNQKVVGLDSGLIFLPYSTENPIEKDGLSRGNKKILPRKLFWFFDGKTIRKSACALSILIKFSVSLSASLSVCESVGLFHSGDFIFKAICNFFFHHIEQALGSVLVQSRFKYL